MPKYITSEMNLMGMGLEEQGLFYLAGYLFASSRGHCRLGMRGIGRVLQRKPLLYLSLRTIVRSSLP